jgi:ABC-type phosphate transport system auxiliary subunit
MSQGQKQEQSQNGNKTAKPELDQDTIKAIISQKSQEVQLEFHRLKLEEKRLEQDGKLSEKAMDYNSKFVKDYPKQHRQTIITYGIFITLTFLVYYSLLAFVFSGEIAEVAKQFLS